MNWQDANNYCANLGDGSRLPTADEYRALKQAMSPGGQYHKNLLPGTQLTHFWSSSSQGDRGAFGFYGNTGYVDNYFCNYMSSVRCVRDGRMNFEDSAHVPNEAPAAVYIEQALAPQNNDIL
jgi:hypothetical protein